MKSNKKCVFNVNFQYNHKQVPTAYFSMMFNIHKHIFHLIFVLVPEYEICNQKIILRSIARQRPFFIDRFHPQDRNRNRPFNLIQNKVGYRSCFATGVNLEQFFMKQFQRRYLNRKQMAKFCSSSPTCFFSNPQWNFMCYYTKVYFNIIPTIHKKYTDKTKQEQRQRQTTNKQPKRKSQIILEINSLDM